MTARGLQIPRGRGHIGGTLAAALAGASIAFATHAQAAPEGPDTGTETIVEQASEATLVDVGQLGAAPMARSRVAGVPPGLAPLRPAANVIVVGNG